MKYTLLLGAEGCSLIEHALLRYKPEAGLPVLTQNYLMRSDSVVYVLFYIRIYQKTSTQSRVWASAFGVKNDWLCQSPASDCMIDAVVGWPGCGQYRISLWHAEAHTSTARIQVGLLQQSVCATWFWMTGPDFVDVGMLTSGPLSQLGTKLF